MSRSSTVEVRRLDRDGNDALVGTLHLEGGRIVPAPADSPLLQRILETEVRLSGGERTTAADDPERFLEVLHLHYKSPYLRATRSVQRE